MSHDHISKADQKADDSLGLILEYLPVGIYYNDFKGKFLYGNRKAEEIIGYARGELIGKSFLKLNLLKKEELGKAARLLAVSALGKPTGPDQFNLRRKDGTIAAVEVRTVVRKIAGKRVTIGMVDDITDQLATNRKLRLQNTYNSLRAKIWQLAAREDLEEDDLIDGLLSTAGPSLDVSRVCFNRLSPDSKHFVCRAEWCSEGIPPTLGSTIPYWAARHFFGSPIIKVTPHNLPPIVKQVITAILRTQQIKTTAIVPYGDVMSPVGFFSFDECKKERNWDEGEVDLLLEMNQIIAMRREQRIAQEAKKQFEEQLNQVQKLEAIGRLAGGIAHDFNNMLGGIMGFADLILQKFSLGNPDLERYASMILNTSERASELNSKLLAFARKGGVELVPVDLHAIVEEVVHIAERTFDKRIRIAKRLTATESIVLGDYAQLENTVLNLAINSKDAMPEGGSLAFSTQVLEADSSRPEMPTIVHRPGKCLLLSVSDTGTGMDKETKRHAFEPFVTTKDLGKGTGLGLASAYGTVKSHHGHIEIESEVGKGTNISIYLPLTEEMTEPKAGQNEKGVAVGAGLAMVVDDEEVIREVASEMLKKLGYEVVTCCDGEEAIEVYRQRWGEICLVILDIMMPKVGGYDCYREFRKINAKVRVLVSSGYADDGEAKRIVAAGASGFLSKPFRFDAFSEAVNQVAGPN